MAIRPTGSPDESPAPVQARAVSIDDRYQSPKEEEAIIVSNPHRNRAHTFLFNTADFGNGESFDPLELELAHNEVLAATLAALKALASRTAPQSIDTSANRAVQAAERYLRAHSVCRRTVSIGLRVEHLQLWGEIHRVVHELAAQNARSCRCSRTRHSSGSWRSQWLDRLRHWFLCVIDEMFSK